MREMIEQAAEPSVDELVPAGSEEALALRFAERHANTLRYVAAWGRWLKWDDLRWAFDDTRQVFSMARAICREAAAEVNKVNVAKALASAKTRAAVLSLASDDRRLAATVDQWDVDPWLLNTPGGVVDLQTGKLRPARTESYMTKVTAVSPRGGCPMWLAFLERVMGGDQELVAFLQRMFGYALTGSTREHSLFFLHGLGANGKSVFITPLAGILGDYHRVAAVETFTASQFDRHPTELAMLRGARLVTAVETEEGRPWAESRIKALTGGDRITARFMRQDFFEFVPTFKLLIAGNHKPGLRSVDEAIKRRIKLVPFEVTIPPEERDPDLAAKLQDEWPGILAWGIEGCAQYLRDGLAPPEAVTAATAAYLDAEDAIGSWQQDCCDLKTGAWAASSQLYASWTLWAEANGERPGSAKRFAQRLEAHGHKPERAGSGQRGFSGLALNPNPPPEQEPM